MFSIFQYPYRSSKKKPIWHTDPDKSLVPVIVMKQAEGKKEKMDFFLIWLKPWESMMPDQIKDMLDSQVRPQTQQISEQMANIPGASQYYEMISQAQQQLANMVNGNGGGSSNGLSTLSALLGRRP